MAQTATQPHVHGPSCSPGHEGHGHAHGPQTPYVRTDAEKQGRNDPCACLSGKKFKKCCGKAD
ncbi:MAG: SEC-C domain-containing protein [Candidatus Sericytochromatia bacterium]|nr:SEC-C domain-containing protein [Candidatus Sericytochromatia bacterium]